jgi:hypothetical protein
LAFTAINNNLKHALFLISANSLKMCLHYQPELISYENLDKLTKRATPGMLCNYILALALYKTFNYQIPLNEGLSLNFSQIDTSKQTTFMTARFNNSKIGMNCLTNCFHHLNGKIPLAWLNKSFNCYNIKCKIMF